MSCIGIDSVGDEVASLGGCLMTAKSHTVKSEADEQSWVQGGPYRLRISAFVSEEEPESPILVLVVHGDAPFHEPDYQYAFAANVAATHRGVVSVGLLRPGYTDPQGNRSDGERGQGTGDSLNATNTDAIAGAIGELKRRWDARQVVVAAHSGGATLAANVLGRHPALIDKALLVSSIYDVEKWRQHMFEKTGAPVFQGEIETLSPIEQVTGMSDQVEVTLMVGSQDEVAPPGFSEQYEAAARRHAKKVRLIQLEGEGHDIFLNPAVFAELGPMLR
jgi:pimeloyl-ACP methyl ester carboxylesterase